MKKLFNIRNSKKQFQKLFQVIAISFITLLAFSSCEQYELPEAGSIEDKTPPSADFVAATNGSHLIYKFTNLSISATDYAWNFGDGNTSSEINPEHTFTTEGKYVVTLTASDKLGVTSSFSTELDIIKPPAPPAIIPVISEASFEDNTDVKGCGTGQDGRDCWRISGGKIFGITSSPVRTGSQGAKFDKNDPRVGYQALTVSPNTDYVVSIWYTIKNDVAGSKVRLAILGQAIGSASEAEANIIAQAYGDNQDDPNTYVELVLEFNSGDRDTIAIWLDSNNVAESRIDDVTISLKD